MSEVSQLLAAKALDGLYLRQQAIAENIANGGSEEFRPKSVDFEASLRAAFVAGRAALADFAPQVAEAAPRSGEDLRLDLEMQDASETALRYAALTDILNRQMQIARISLRGGQ